MKLGIPAETNPGETRVAATPETVKKLTSSGMHHALVESGAGVRASIPDDQFTAAGATIVPSAAHVYREADIVLKVRGPDAGELAQMREGQILIGMLQPYNKEGTASLATTARTRLTSEA